MTVKGALITAAVVVAMLALVPVAYYGERHTARVTAEAIATVVPDWECAEWMSRTFSYYDQRNDSVIQETIAMCVYWEDVNEFVNCPEDQRCTTGRVGDTALPIPSFR